MTHKKDIVITGIGIISPIGIGQEAFWASLCDGRSGVRRLNIFDTPDIIPFGGEVVDFDPKVYIRQRKSLKMMNRDIQFGCTAADIACKQAGHREKAFDPERLGVIFGADMMPCELDEIAPAYRNCIVDGRFDFARWGHAAMTEIFPLWMLKYLPNMPGCQIAIAQDARGPNNTHTLGDVSGLSAAAEAARVIERGAADAMIVGAAGSRIHPTVLFRGGSSKLSQRGYDPAGASRPFDANRDGIVNGEGAAAFIFEYIAHAKARGSELLGRVLGCAAAFEPTANDQVLQGRSIRQAMLGAIRDSGIAPSDIGCVVAHGISAIEDDRREASAIREVLGDVPVTAPKSYFGHPGAACGALDMAVAIMILKHRQIPPTLNYRVPDPHCPIRVVHDRPEPLEKTAVMLLSHSQHGQAVALVLGSP